MRLTMNAMGSKVLAVKKLSFATVVTVTTQFGVVGGDLVSEREARDLGSYLDYDATALMASNNWHSRPKHA